MRLNTKYFLLPILVLVLFVLLPEVSQATGFELFPGERAGANDYRIYVQNFYRFSIGAGILIATVLIMIGGIMWTTSAGNPGRIDKAKDYITDSIIGVVLLLGAYTILSLINPNLVNLPKVSFPKFGDVGACLITTKGKQACTNVAEQLCVAGEESTATFQGANTNCAVICPKVDEQGNCRELNTEERKTQRNGAIDTFQKLTDACKVIESMDEAPGAATNESSCRASCGARTHCEYASHGSEYRIINGVRQECGTFEDAFIDCKFDCTCTPTQAALIELQRLKDEAARVAETEKAAEKK